jgi:hypothetical protein
MRNQKMDEFHIPGTRPKQKLPLSLLLYLPAPRWRSLSALIIVVLILLVFVGYMVNSAIRYGQLEDQLENHESLWESKGIENYQYILRASNENGIAAIAVRVEEGSSAIAKRQESRYRGEISEILPLDVTEYDSVPDLFDKVRQAIEERHETGTVKLAIQYDEETGYPLSIRLVPRYYYANDLYQYILTDFKVLEPPESRYARLAENLNVNEQLWQSMDISDYEFTLIARTDESDSRIRITVKNGNPVLNDSNIPLQENLENLDTIPEIFARIRKAIDEKEEEGFNRIYVNYNNDTGYPSYFSLRDSYQTGDPGIYSYSITDFKIMD